MKYSREEILRKEKEMESERRRWINQIRLNVVCLNLLIFLGLLAFACACFFGMLGGMIQSAPEVTPDQILNASTETSLYDVDGQRIQGLNGKNEKKSYVYLDSISDGAQKAFVALADEHYYEHKGLDLRGIFSDFEGKEANQYKYRTLTQKLLRNAVFYNENTYSIYERMRQEIQLQYVAINLEKEYGKNQVLELYLNTLSFGNNLIGIQTAADVYFGKSAEELSISEAALLAAVSENCDTYNPITHPEENSVKRKDILSHMLSMGVISEDEYEDALGDDVYVEFQKKKIISSVLAEANDYYADAVITSVAKDLQSKLGYTQTQAYHAIYHDGLKIYSCQDQKIQNICNQEAQKIMDQNDKELQISFVIIDQENGQVKALLGGRPEEKVYTGKNRAMYMTRNAGEALGLLSVWVPAIDTAGMTLATVQDDSPFRYKENGKETKLTHDGKYSGLVTMRDSISKERLLPAAKTLSQINVQTGYDYLKQLGISTLVENKEDADGNVCSDISISLALGNMIQGVSNLELTSAYSVLAAMGIYREPSFYTKVLDKNGKVILSQKEEEHKVLKSTSAWLIGDALKDCAAQERNQDADFSFRGIHISGISGVSENGSDTWFEGYTPYFTAGIWCGYDAEDTSRDEKTCQSIWKNIMQKVHEEKKNHLGKGVEFNSKQIISRKICIKSGKLAIDNLCDEAIGGNCARMEYFVRGTEPVENCDCHNKFYFCKKSGKIAGENCPKNELEERVYLEKNEDVKTLDSDKMLPKKLKKKYCDCH